MTVEVSNNLKAIDTLYHARDLVDVLATAFRAQNFDAEECLEGLHSIAVIIGDDITRAIAAIEQEKDAKTA